MATVPEIERLGALIEKLIPRSGLRPGDLILAQDWNEIVGVLIEVTRTFIAQERETAVPPHEHPDQVGVGWLDPRLRALVERGTGAEPETEGKLNGLDRRISRLDGRLEALASDVGGVRDRVSEVATRDLTRQADVTAVRRVVEGLSDARDDVLAMRETLKSIQADVKTAVDVSSRLVVNGQPVDMAAIDGRIKSVEELRDRLRSPTGELLDARALEIRLTEFTNRMITQQQLDEALKSRPTQVAPGQLAEIEDRVKSGVVAEIGTRVDQLGGHIRGEVEQRFAAVDAQVSRGIADATPGLRASVLDAVRPEIATATVKAVADARIATEERVSETDAALRQELTRRFTEAAQTLAAAVRTEFDRQLPGQLETLRKDIASLADKVGPLGGKIAEHDDLLSKVGTRVEVVARDDTAALVALRQSLLSEIDTRNKTVLREVNERIGRLEPNRPGRVDSGLEPGPRL